MRRATKLVCLAVLTIVWLAATTPTRAELVYSNLGPDPGYDEFFAWGFGTDPGDPPFWDDVAYGVPFTPQIDAQLESIRVVAGLIWGTNRLNVTLAADEGGLPGAAIESFDLSDVLPDIFEPEILAIASILQPWLQAGTTYWVVLDAPDPTTFGGWFVTSSYEVGSWAESDANGPFYRVIDILPALEVTGNVVPEPSAAWLIILGLFTSIRYGRSSRSG